VALPLAPSGSKVAVPENSDIQFDDVRQYSQHGSEKDVLTHHPRGRNDAPQGKSEESNSAKGWISSQAAVNGGENQEQDNSEDDDDDDEDDDPPLDDTEVYDWCETDTQKLPSQSLPKATTNGEQTQSLSATESERVMAGCNVQSTPERVLSAQAYGCPWIGGNYTPPHGHHGRGKGDKGKGKAHSGKGSRIGSGSGNRRHSSAKQRPPPEYQRRVSHEERGGRGAGGSSPAHGRGKGKGSGRGGGAGQPGAKVVDTNVIKKVKAAIDEKPHPNAWGDWINKRKIVNNYIIIKDLGKGAFAEVKLCKEKEKHGQKVEKLRALKIINRNRIQCEENSQAGALKPAKNKLKANMMSMDDVKREIAIMKKLHHPHVLRLYEVMDDPNINKLYLVLEYMDSGDLMTILRAPPQEREEMECMKKLRKRTGQSNWSNLQSTYNHSHKPQSRKEVDADKYFPLEEHYIHLVMRQVIQGVSYLHHQNVVHGDIKPQNLLINSSGVVKIADFGISRQLAGDVEEKLLETVGTPVFMCPELCGGLEYSGQLADVWALGGTMYMLLVGHPPFQAKKPGPTHV